jgi:arylformamidase
MRSGKVLDITIPLGDSTYPGDTPYRREGLNSGPYQLSKLEMSAHCSTHLDAPSHFFLGKSIDAYHASSFILSAQVVPVDSRLVRADHVNIGPGGDEAVLFKANPPYQDSVYLSMPAAEACIRLGLCLVGITSLSVDRMGDEEYPVHRRLMGADILILEGIDLQGVPVGPYTLICLPLKIKEGEASPVRAVLVSQEV